MTDGTLTEPSPSAVPGPEHYGRKYFSKRFARIASYRVQAQLTVEALKGVSAPSVLLVGKGDGIVEAILARCGVGVTTLDIQAELEPDIVASVESIPAEDGSFDCVVCCQVLEHLPFEKFRACVAELRRVCRSPGGGVAGRGKRASGGSGAGRGNGGGGGGGGLILSLPDQRPYFSLGVALANTQRHLALSLPVFPPRPIPPDRLAKMGHHWEIGYRGTPIGRVRREIAAAGLRITRTVRVRDLPWHTFFACES